MKTLGVLTNGGDTCSLNALLEAVQSAALMEGFNKIYGIQGGYRGLITNKAADITDVKIDPNQGGSFLLSLRDSPLPKEVPKTKEAKKLWKAKLRGALKTVNDLDLDVLVVVGGDGTIEATNRFAEYVAAYTKCKILAFPRTIDNDIGTMTYHAYNSKKIESVLSPGYSTAAYNIAKVAKRLRATARTTKRVFTLETMGRDAGWLALASALGGAEIGLIPEHDISRKVEKQLYKLVAEYYKRFENCIVGVSEGTKFDGKQVKQTQYGARKLGGAGDLIALGGKLDDDRYFLGIEEGLKKLKICQIDYPNGYQGKAGYEMKLYPEVRAQPTGYAPRMGSPSQYDLRLAKVLGKRLRIMLRNEEFNHLPTLDLIVPYEELNVNYTKSFDIRRVKQQLLPIEDYYDTKKLAATPAFLDLMTKIITEKEMKYLMHTEK